MEKPAFQDCVEKLQALAPKIDPEKLNRAASFGYGLMADESSELALPEFPVDNLGLVAQVWVSRRCLLYIQNDLLQSAMYEKQHFAEWFSGTSEIGARFELSNFRKPKLFAPPELI